MEKPIGILFDSYRHFSQWIDLQPNINEFIASSWKWKLRDSDQVYIAVIPEINIKEDSFNKWNRYQGIEFKDILGPDYKKVELDNWLSYRIRP